MNKPNGNDLLRLTMTRYGAESIIEELGFVSSMLRKHLPKSASYSREVETVESLREMIYLELEKNNE